MKLVYIDPVTKVTHLPIFIHNFNREGLVRIMGSRYLNPEDLSYPDKKWVSQDDIRQLLPDGELVPVTFDDKMIKVNTL